MDWDFQAVIADVPAVLFRGYADGSIDLFDRKVEAMTGHAREEFETRQRKWTDLILDADLGPARDAFLGALRSGKAYTREYRIQAKAGQHVWVHERSWIVCDANGRIEYVSGLFFDITERKLLEQRLHKSEQDFRILVDNIPALTFKGYIDGAVELFDDKVEALLGYPRDSFGTSGTKWTDLVWEEDREGHKRVFIQALKTNRAYVREYRMKAASGRPVWIHERSHIVCDADGRVQYISGLFFDISERKELEATVAERTQELQHANDRLVRWGKELEHRNSEINLLGQMGDLLQSCNTSAEAHSGFQVFAKQLFPEDSGTLFVFGESAHSVEAVASWGDKRPGESEFSVDDCWGLRRGRVHGRPDVEAGLRCRHVADAAAAYLCVPVMAHGAALGVLHLLLASGDAERWDARQQLGTRVGEHLGLALAKLRLQETLQHLSVRDPLTGLYNRRYMEESLARELRRAERQGKPLGIIMVDIDHFKRFNDTCGHDAGDALLKELGSLLQRRIRAGDIACRYGGEEFTVVLLDASPETTQRRAEEIREAAKQLKVQHAARILDPVTLSLGVATYPQNGDTRDALMQNADVALYRAKQEGRDRVCAA
jgi:diguanylate cyclase (GGDEF)-like protein/PAS domain S-box-containing protein